MSNTNFERMYTELHIGGLPEIIQDEEALTQFLNEHAIKKGINLSPGNPITGTRINSGGRFAFAIFRTREEATKGMELTGIVCQGSILRFERPKGFRTNQPAPMDENQIINLVLMTTPNPIMEGYTREELKKALEEELTRLGDSTSLVEWCIVADETEVNQQVRLIVPGGGIVGVKMVGEGRYLIKTVSISEAEKLIQCKKMYKGVKITSRFRPLKEWDEANTI